MSLAVGILGAAGAFFVMMGIMGAVALCAHTVLGLQAPEILRGLAKASLGMIGIGAAMSLFWVVLGPLRLL